ncbi:MAG: type IX secretion system membrane protein PorP/SprF [Raineya sp.]|nr:type IX secretion system membrane protein PorP/SprF [Raineya sp.]
MPFHLHNFNNYSLLNPAAAGLPPLFGIPEDPLFFFTHHRQQIGAFDNVPIFNSLSFNKNFNAEVVTPNSWGGHLYNFQRSIWRTTGGWLSYARELKINAFGLPVNSLRLGLALGAENDGLNTDDPDILSDPAIVNRRDKFARPVGQFGFLYVFGGKSGTSVWELGGGLPKLFKSSRLDNTVSGFYPISNWFVSISRQIQSQKIQNWYMKPMAIFRTFDNKQRVLEINNMLNYYEGLRHHWFGGSWIQGYGFAAIVGTKFYKTKFGISYSYKFNAEKAGFNKNPVHEIQLIYNLKRLSKIISDTIPTNQEPEIDSTVYDDDMVMDTVFVDDTLSLPEIEEPDLIVHPDTLTEPTRVKLRQKKYINYVVVGAFVVKGNAERQVRLLKRDNNIDAKIRFRSGYYNVHVLETESTDDAEKVAIEMQKRLKDKTVWMLCVPKKPDKPDKKE